LIYFYVILSILILRHLIRLPFLSIAFKTYEYLKGRQINAIYPLVLKWFFIVQTVFFDMKSIRKLFDCVWRSRFCNLLL